MPQTRFVLGKALGHGLKPIVVVNKVDKPDARPDWVVDQVFDLLASLDATDEQMDILDSIIYASAKNGWADHVLDGPRQNMQPLFQTIIEHVPAPKVENPDPDAPLQMMVTSLAFSEYVGRIAIGRVHRGTVHPRDHRLGREPGRQGQPAEDAQGPGLRRLGPHRHRRRHRRRPLRRGRAGPHRHRQHDLRPRRARSAAGRRHRRAHGHDDLPRERQPLRRPRGHVRHEPAGGRPPRPRAAEQRRAPRGARREPRAVRGLRPGASCTWAC